MLKVDCHMDADDGANSAPHPLKLNYVELQQVEVKPKCIVRYYHVCFLNYLEVKVELFAG